MSTQDRNTYGDILCQAVDTIVTQRLSALEYDQTILCSIVDDSRREEGIYRVTNGSMVFEAVSDQTNYRNDNNVYVLIPKGKWEETKIITGKKNNKDSEISYIYRNPFDYLVDATNNMIKKPLDDAIGLVANDPSRTEIIIWTYNNTEDSGILNDDGLDLAGYTRLGIQAQFRSWLNPFYTPDQQASKVIEGSYGLKLKITTVGDTIIKDTNAMSKTYELYIDASDMNGNPYDFNTFFQQEKVFDISGFGKITSMELSFYQKPGTFVDAQGIPIPHQGFLNKLVDNNLFIKDPYISLGYDTREFQNDDIIIYTLNTPTFTSAASDSENQKTVQIRWLHEFEEDGEKVLRIVEQEDLEELGATINWYRYRFGAQSADMYSGVYWEYANQEAENRFSYTFDPDVTRADERIKVIVFYNNNDKTSNTVVFTNEKEVVNQATLDATSAVGITCLDGTYGNYRIYNLNNSLLESNESTIDRYFELSFGDSLLTEAQSVEWIIPKENTMIVIQDSFITENEGKLNGEITDNNYHIIRENLNGEEGKRRQRYKIENRYSQDNNNNTVICKVKKDNITYVGVKELTFGIAGTNGTDATFVLDFDNGINALTKGNTEAVIAVARLYNYNNIEVPISNHDIDWTFKTGTGISITPQSDNNKVELKLINSSIVPNYNILQATLKGFGDYELIAYLPIPIRTSKEYNYISGATTIVYDSQGRLVKDKFNSNPYILYKNGNPIEATWNIISDSDVGDTIKFAPELKDNMLYPKTIYVKEDSEKVCICAAVDGNVVWSQPILITQNQYFAKVINDWNGLLNIDKKNNSIMSARMVAGRKESDNTFSGVMMGDWKGQDAETNITKNTGIYGFNHGAASFGFRDDGTAFIGKSGSGRIEFDGEKGIIKSPDDQGMIIDLNDGKITSEKFDLKVGKFNNDEDKYIYLSSTHNIYPLRIGTNFSVEWDGTVTANSGTFKGAIEASSGTIGAWTISETDENKGALYAGDTYLYPSGKIEAGNNGNFEVSASGNLTAKKANISGTINADGGKIGGWTIQGDVIDEDTEEIIEYAYITNATKTVKLDSQEGIITNYVTIKNNNTEYGKIGYFEGNNNKYVLGVKSDNNSIALESIGSIRLTSGGFVNGTYNGIILDAGEGGTTSFAGEGVGMSDITYLVMPEQIKAYSGDKEPLVELDREKRTLTFNCTVNGITGSSTAVFG